VSIRDFFADIAKAGARWVTFTGGEPFMRKDILDIAKFAKDSGMEVSFISNGALINADIARRIVELGVDSICFSLDGCRDVHNNVRGR